MTTIEMQQKFFQYMTKTGDRIAIRALRTNKNGSVEQVFDDADKAIAFANRQNDRSDITAVYFAVNPVKADYADTFVKDGDIDRRTILFIDIDAAKKPAEPLKPKDVSSTPAELEATHELARDVVAWLAEQGVTQEPIIAMSGNGTHIFYKIDMPNDEKSLQDMHLVLKALSDKFTGDRGELDVKVKNASRICKLPGTKSIKGIDGIEEGRNHRTAYVMQWPSCSAEDWQSNPIDSAIIDQIASHAEVEVKATQKRQAAERKAKSRGVERKTEYKPRNEIKKEKQMTYINRNEFLINHYNVWINAAYNLVESPEDRNQWLGMLTSVKTLQGEAGWTTFDAWCARAAGYDANGNRQAWESPARSEDDATEALKLAYSFMKLGVDFDEVAEANGYELSKEEVMSIDEIKAIIANDNSQTVRWAWSTRHGKYYPAGVWAKDISKRRLETMNDSVRAESLLSLFISTDIDNGMFVAIDPFIMSGTDDMYVFNEDFGVWDKLEPSFVQRQVSKHNGYTVVGKKDGMPKTLLLRDAKFEIRQMVGLLDNKIPNSSQKLAFNNTALVFNGKSVSQRKAQASDMFTHKMDMDYAGATPTPEFDAILERLFEGDAERIECYLQWAGSTIMGANTSLQLPMMLLISEVGGTGKSMLLKLLELIVGMEKTAAVILKDLSDRGILTFIASKNLVVDYDVNLDCILDNVDILKNLITGEGMNRRVVGSKQTIDVRYRGAVCGAANGNPSFKSYDSGMDRRLLLMPTTNKAITKTEVVREYEVKLFRKEGAGIVHKMIEAFKRMLVAGDLLIPQICQEAKQEFRAEVDVVSTWFSERFEFNAEEKPTLVKDLYRGYAVWCEQNGHHAVSATKFTRSLKTKATIAGGDITVKNGYPAIKISEKQNKIGFN